MEAADREPLPLYRYPSTIIAGCQMSLRKNYTLRGGLIRQQMAVSLILSL